MLIEVTQQDIDTPRKCGDRLSTNCPLARAISRAAGVPWGVGVKLAGPLSGRCYATLPPAAEEFRALFDIGDPVAPFTFELNIEAPSNAN